MPGPIGRWRCMEAEAEAEAEVEAEEGLCWKLSRD